MGPLNVSGPDERHTPHTSGITTALMLSHVQARGGPAAVDAVLERIGKPGSEAALRDERSWWSWDTKIALFEAAAEVLGDPAVTRTAGATAIGANVAAPLKAGLRALGSPGLVYGNIVRANHKFSTASRMVLEDLSVHRAVIRYELIDEVEPSRLDCLYNQGLLACVPLLFDLPLARVDHPACALHGAAQCVYEVAWHPRQRSRWPAVATATAATAGSAGALAAVAPAALPAAATVAAGLAAWWSARRRHALLHALGAAERRLEVQADRSEHVRASLHALVSALDQDAVGAEICEHASTALGGQETVLLLEDRDGRVRADASSLAEADVLEALEHWAAVAGAPVDIVEMTDLRGVPGLGALPDRQPPVASLCAAPLRARGERLGSLVVLAPRADSFLPGDVATLGLFAEQASVALSNARLYAAQQQMAMRDPLTGLRNHREFQDAVSAEVARSRRGASRFSVALLDLDGFKAVNDGAGHAAGDRLLAGVAAVLEGAGREGDAVFRVGGDEFAVLLPDSDADQARAATARIADAGASVDDRVGVSWGIATWPADGHDKDALLARADARLYDMKRTRRRRRRPRRARRAPARRRPARLRGR